MKYEKLLIFLMPILLVIMAILGYIKLINNDDDSIKFKKEYEKLNSSEEYYKISIAEKNQVKYSSYKQIFNVLKNSTGIIYFGYPEDNNSRFAIETLLNVIEDNKIDTTVYYLDIHSDRDSYTIENNKLVYEKDSNGNEIEGTKEYFGLMSYLDKFLGEYVLYFEDEEYNTNEKRIPIPAIIFVKDGNILGLEYGSIDIEYEDLYSIYEDYVLEMYSSTCDTNAVDPC